MSLSRVSCLAWMADIVRVPMDEELDLPIIPPQPRGLATAETRSKASRKMRRNMNDERWG